MLEVLEEFASMVQLSLIEAQLTKLGVKKTWFCRPELRELQHILMDDEKIVGCVTGRYTGGFAILVATDIRLLLIDKKPFYLTVEDIRYDMIAEIDISARLIDATVTLFTVNKQLVFTSIRHKLLRDLTLYAQKRVMELRHYQQVAPPEPQTPPVHFMPSYQPSPSPLPAPNSNTTYISSTYNSPVMPPRQHSPHLPHIMGSAAVAGAHRRFNPYTRGSFMIRRRRVPFMGRQYEY
jgi:PH (Pleckstrin Homology) domain-containing protein